MNYSCDMIQDLIPLVNDGVSSEESARIVASHLETCENCMQYDFQCKNDLQPQEVKLPDISGEGALVTEARSYKKRIVRRLLIIPSILAGIAIIFFVCQLGLILIAYFGLTVFADSYETSDIADFGIYEGHIEYEDMTERSKLAFFPVEIDIAEKVNQFYYACSEAGLDNSYFLVLDYNLSAEDFHQEIERFERISVEYDGETKTPIYDEDSFSLPAYVSVFGRNGSNSDFGDFEYVLIDQENNRLICVLVISEYLLNLPIDRILKPPAELNYVDSWEGFSIYSFPLKGIDGTFVPNDDEAVYSLL